jgi:hypothetical protein
MDNFASSLRSNFIFPTPHHLWELCNKFVESGSRAKIP